MQADRRLYLTEDREMVVEHGDPRARFLLVGKGGEIPASEVQRLGLVLVDGRVVQPRAGDRTKAVQPAEDKMVRRRSDKSARG